MKNTSTSKMFALGASAIVLLMGTISTLSAAEAAPDTHDGQFVSIANNVLMMTSEDGQEQTHKLANQAKITLDGKPSKASELKAGMTIRVTTGAKRLKVATHIEAIEKNKAFAQTGEQKPNTHDGKLVSMTKETFRMSDADGKEHQHTLAIQSEVTCDGQPCKLSDLKVGMKIRVTTKQSKAGTAIKIEALDKNVNFA